MRGIITLLIHNGIYNVISQAQGDKHLGDQGPVHLSKHSLALAVLGSLKVPCGPSQLAGQTSLVTFSGGFLSGMTTFLASLAMRFHVTWEEFIIIIVIFWSLLPVIDIILAWISHSLGLGKWFGWLFSV